MQNKVADLQGRISQQRKSLDYYSEAALREADALQESSMLKFRESEIGYFGTGAEPEYSERDS